MPLNKFAGFGFASIARPRPLGLTAVTQAGFDKINQTLAIALPPAPPPPPPPAPIVPTPSATALRIVWSLNAARDALHDQDDPNIGNTNEMLKDRLESDAVEDIFTFLADAHPTLLEPYRSQFRPLVADSDEAFRLERRERLAELATFELMVMATVGDPPVPPTPTPPPGPAVKSRAPRRGVVAKRR